MPIRYRYAELADSSLILNWRNDDSVRSYSRDQAFIPTDRHKLWFAARIDKIRTEPILIFSSESIDIGFTRLDLINQGAGIVEFSIVVSPTLRNKGFGSLMLKETIKVARSVLGVREINATVRIDNLASLNLFIGCGFKVLNTTADFKVLKLELSENISN
jgi:RimJ/RimL family protein N-acetyltransferase